MVFSPTGTTGHFWWKIKRIGGVAYGKHRSGADGVYTSQIACGEVDAGVAKVLEIVAGPARSVGTIVSGCQ